MGSRLLPLSVALGTALADATGLHRVAFYLALLAVIAHAPETVFSALAKA
jgi:hypothetical protein